MKKPASLRSRRDFQRVLKGGRRTRVRCGTFVVASGPASEAPARLGLAIPSSVGGAVVRNRIKRRLRAAFVAASPPHGTDVVIRATDAAAFVPFQELEKAIRSAVRS